MPGILDRYILSMFFRMLVVTFASMSGLIVVVQLFSNLEELTSTGWWTLVDFFAPRVLQYFDHIGAMVVLLAAIFAITTLMRTNELTAIMAAGISKGRVVKPLMWAAIAVSLLGVVNRECWIPQFREKLIRNAQNWDGSQPKTLRPTYDYHTDVYLGGQQTVAVERAILGPNFRLPTTGAFGDFGHQLLGARAVNLPATAEHPAGYLVEQVHTPEHLAELASVELQGETVILCPRDAPWLAPDQCFLISDVSFEQLAGGTQWRQLASTREIMTSLRNPSLQLGNDARVQLHARILQPGLDLTLFMLGIPLVLSRDHRNIFVAAGMCVGLVAVFFVVVMLCHALGANYILSPAFAAWLPLFIFVPAAYATAAPLWR